MTAIIYCILFLFLFYAIGEQYETVNIYLTNFFELHKLFIQKTAKYIAIGFCISALFSIPIWNIIGCISDKIEENNSKTICSWCNKHLKGNTNGTIISHGMCQECSDKLINEAVNNGKRIHIQKKTF